jgi:outer membrane receptor protein involved in Fe transport
LTPFGTYFGPRAGLAYEADPLTTVRASAGTTYESPQLAGLVVPYPFPIGGGNFITVGTPGLSPDRATEYGFGIDRTIVAGRDPAVLSADVYRVDLRAPAGPGSGVYDGIAFSAHRSFGPYARLSAQWAVRSQYLAAWPGDAPDAEVLPGEQTAGAPLHEARLVFDAAPPLGVIYGFDVIYEGLYNELDAPPFAVVGAHAGYRLRGLEIRLDGSNLTNVFDRRFTTPGAGMVYAGPNGPIAQSAYPLQGTSFTLSLARRF